MRDRTLEDTFYILFTTRAFATGIPTTLAGTPVVSAYEDSSVTQIAAGITLGVDHDGVTGLNLLTIVATAANGYETAKDYGLVITTGTVGGVSVVGEAVGEFSLSLSSLSAATVAGLVDDVWDEVLTGATHNVPSSAGRRLRSIGDVTSGTVDDAAATTTSFISTLTGTHDDHFADQTLFFTDGSLSGMSRIISEYVSSTKEIIFDEPLPAAPGNGDGFDVNPVHVHTETQIADFVWNEIISKATHNISGSAAKILRQGGDLVQIDGVVSDVSPAVDNFDTNLTQADTYFDDAVLIFSNGAANAGIGRAVSAYLNANGNVAFDAPDDWPVTPVNGDDFVIYATHVHPVAQIADGILDEALAGHTAAGTLGKAVIDIEADTNELQANQGNWLTATGFSTHDAAAVATAVLTTQMTESYAANGIAPTLAQAQFAMHQMLMQFGIAGTAWTVRKLDDTATAFVVTLDDATNPTDAKRV